MMETIDIVQLEEAVVLFYRSTSQQQAITHQWLTKAQTSPQAWQFSWQLMQLDKCQEVQFFGAITLHSKLLKFWHEVPEENRLELKQKILETIIQFASGPKMVLNRLCMALSAFIVHTIFQEWQTAIEDVINIFQNQQMPNVSKEMQIWILMEVLYSIPEEMKAIYTPIKRATLRGEVSKRAGLVLTTTDTILKIHTDQEWNPEIFSSMTKAVKCVSMWFKYIGFPIDHSASIASGLLKIVNKCYWPCVNEPNHDGCMSADENELAESCLKALLNMITQPDCHLYPKSAFILIKMFLDSLCDITKMEWKRDNNNEDIVVNIYTLLVSSVERHSQMLLGGISTTDTELSSVYTRLVNEILCCTDKPGIYPVEESCSALCLGFWYMLQDEVFALNNDVVRQNCWSAIKPLYAHLVQILVRKLEQPDEDSINKWSSDDLETFRCYRQDLADGLMYCYDVLHESILTILDEILGEIITVLQNNPNKWTKLEACIYAFQSVAEQFTGDESKEIEKLMIVLSEIPYDKVNERLLGTSLETIGSYCQWLKENPTFIPNAMQLLLKGLNTSMTAQATLGLKELCRDCQLQLQPFAEPLLDACHSAVSSGQMKNTDCIRLMFSIGKLMSVVNAEKMPKYLDTIVGPCFEELQLICQRKSKTPDARKITIFRLNIISTLFSSLNTDLEENSHIYDMNTIQPVLMIMQKTMPIFCEIAELWFDELDVLDAACSSLKHAVINLRHSFKPMLEDLCFFIVSIFEKRCCPSALEISRTIIILFYKEDGCSLMMNELLIQVTRHTLLLLQSTEDDAFSNLCDIIESFYGCLMIIIKKIPEILLANGIALDRLIFFALKAITLPELGPIRCGIQFLTHLIMQSTNFFKLRKEVLDAGENIICTVLLCVGCLTPRQQVDKFSDLLLAINKKYPAELVTWLKVAIQADFFSNEMVDLEERNRFVMLIIREKVNKRLLQTYLMDFAIKVRGLTDKFH